MVRTLGLRLTSPFRRATLPAPAPAEPPPSSRDLGGGSAPSFTPADPEAAFAQQCALAAFQIGAGVGLLWLAGAQAALITTRQMMEI